MKIRFPLLLLSPYLLTLSIFIIGPVRFSDVSMIFLSLSAFSAFSFLLAFQYGVRKSKAREHADSRADEFIVRWYTYMSPIIAASSIVFVTWLIGRGTSLQLVLTETGEVREVASGSSPVKQIAGIFAYQAYGYIPILATKWRLKFNLSVNILMAIAISIMAFAVVLQAGRTFFLVAPVMVFACYIVGSRDLRRFIWRDMLFWILVVTIILLGAIISFFIGTQRVSQLEIITTIQLSEYRYLEDFFNGADDRVTYFSTVFFHYLAGPWSNFNIALQSEVNFWRFSLGPLEAMLGSFFDLSFFSEVDGRAESLRSYIALGGQPTGWRTGFGNALIWHGFFGVFLYAVALGFFCGYLIEASRRNASISIFLRAVWVISLFVLCVFYFPSNSIFWVNFAFLFAVVPILSRVRFRARSC